MFTSPLSGPILQPLHDFQNFLNLQFIPTFFQWLKSRPWKCNIFMRIVQKGPAPEENSWKLMVIENLSCGDSRFNSNRHIVKEVGPNSNCPVGRFVVRKNDIKLVKLERLLVLIFWYSVWSVIYQTFNLWSMGKNQLFFFHCPKKSCPFSLNLGPVKSIKSSKNAIEMSTFDYACFW